MTWRIILLHATFIGFNSGLVKCQDWELIKTIATPGLIFSVLGNESDRIALKDGSLAYSKNGSIYLHQRNAGGFDQWEIADTYEPDLIPGSQSLRYYDGAVAPIGSGLFAASVDGVWNFSITAQGLVRNYRIDSLAPLSIASSERMLCVSSRGIDVGLVRCWAAGMLQEGIQPFWFGSWNLPTGSTPFSGISCFGSAVVVKDSYLAITDPCRTFIPASHSGLIWVGELDPEDPGNGYLVQTESESGEQGYGRSVGFMGDTVFVGVSEHWGYWQWMDVRHLGGSEPMERIATIVPNIGELPFTYLGYSVIADGERLYVGTDSGFATFVEQGGTWELVHHEYLGFPVVCMDLDGSDLAVAVADPFGGRIEIFRRFVYSGYTEMGPFRLSAISILPNPARASATIITDDVELKNLLVLDALGRCIKVIPVYGSTLTIVRDYDLTQGPYFLRGVDGVGATRSIGKIVLF